MSDRAKILREIAADPELIKVAHKGLEDVLVEWRDDRLSTPFVGNGLVIRERDGTDSSMIRIPTAEAVAMALRFIAAHLEEGQ